MTIDPFALAAVLDITDGCRSAYYDGTNVVVRSSSGSDDVIAELDVSPEFPTVASGPVWRADDDGNLKEVLAHITYDFEGDREYDEGARFLIDECERASDRGGCLSDWDRDDDDDIWNLIR